MASVEERLFAVSPIDGRYGEKVDELRPILSEFGLIKRRVAVEAGWLTTLGSGVLPDVDPLGQAAIDHLYGLADEDFYATDAVEIKEIEKDTNHDVKAIEVW